MQEVAAMAQSIRSEDDDTRHLIAPSNAGAVDIPRTATPNDTDGSRCSRCRLRWPPFFVEPVLILYFFSEFPVDIIAQKYILDWIGDWLRHNPDRSIFTDLQYAAAAAGGGSNPCSVNGSSNDAHFQDRVQSLASWFGVLQSGVWGVPAIVSTVVLGACSDRLGRRFAVLPCLVGVLATSSTAFFVVWYRAPIFWLFAGDLVYGFCGSFAAMTMSCFAYVADRTPADRRMLRIVVVEMCMLLAGVVSPICVGWVVDRLGYAYTLLIVVGSSSANFFYVFFFLPGADEDDGEPSAKCEAPVGEVAAAVDVDGDEVAEPSDAIGSAFRQRVDVTDVVANDVDDSLTAPLADSARQAQHSSNGACALEASVNVSADDVEVHFRSPRRTCFSACGACAFVLDDVRRAAALLLKPGARRWKILLLLFAFFITNLPLFNVSVGTLFEMNHPLCWTINEVGIFTGVSLGVSTVGGIIAAPLMKMCMPDIAIAIFGALCAAVTNIYKSFVRNSAMMFACKYILTDRFIHLL
jgi:MFS family permease